MARFTITMPDDLRAQVKKLGEQEARGLSAQIVTLVRKALQKSTAAK